MRLPRLHRPDSSRRLAHEWSSSAQNEEDEKLLHVIRTMLYRFFTGTEARFVREICALRVCFKWNETTHERAGAKVSNTV